MRTNKPAKPMRFRINGRAVESLTARNSDALKRVEAFLTKLPDGDLLLTAEMLKGANIAQCTVGRFQSELAGHRIQIGKAYYWGNKATIAAARGELNA